MYFVSFQPHDWRIAVKKPEYRELYSDVTGWNGMYCIPAERLDVALVNACGICPTTPELCLWFKTNDWYAIPKIEHYQYLDDGPVPVCCSRAGLVRAHRKAGRTDRFEDMMTQVTPYDFEFLVDRDSIEPFYVTDIKARMLEVCTKTDKPGDADVRADVIGSNVRVWTERYRESDSIWMTEERAPRDAEAVAWFQWYAVYNDYFIKDYKRVIGMKPGERDVSTAGVHPSKYDKLRAAFDKYPSKKTFTAFVKYMESVIYAA